MRVLIVSSWYPPIQSGSSLWAEALVAGLRRRGHEVRVVTTSWPGMPGEPVGTRSEVVYRVPARVLPRSRLLLGLAIAPLANGPANRRRMLEIVRNFQPDVIHQINHIFDTLFLSAHAARETGTPLVGSITTPIQSPSPFIHPLMRAVDATLLYHCGIRHWRRVICSDSAQARYALDAYGERVRPRLVQHIHVGLHQRIRAARPSARASAPTIISVGHVHAIRDPSNLIRALVRVREQVPDARLDIAGRIQTQAPVRLVRRLGLDQAVHFLGEVRHGSLPELISQARVFAILHQCRYAGLSFTAIEAMHLGVPVVINAPADTYGPDGLADGRNIMLVDGGDVGQITERLLRLLRDPALRQMVGQGGQDFVARRLNWDVTAEQTERLYQEVVGERHLRFLNCQQIFRPSSITQIKGEAKSSSCA
jgi:glycosyltransferase involved in cell wall biosynthesis